MNIGELFIELGFKADTMKLKEFMSAVGELNMSSIAGALGLGALYEATAKIMGIADKTAMSIFNYTQVTGLSGKEMQQFSNYADEMGVSAEDAQGSLKNLQMSMLNVKLGRGNAEPFNLTGIDVNEKNPIKSLQQLQDFVKATKEIDPALHRMIVSEFGISENMLQILKTSDRITESIKSQPFATEKEVNAIREYHKALADLGHTVNLLFTRWGAALTPVIKHLDSLASKLLEILRTGEGIKSLFQELGAIFKKLSPLYNLSRLAGMGIKIGEKNIEKNLKFIMSDPNSSKVALSQAGNSNVTNEISVSVSGVQDPDKASDLVTSKLSKMLTDRYYHEKVQER